MKEPHFDEDMYLQEQYGEDDYSEEELKEHWLDRLHRIEKENTDLKAENEKLSKMLELAINDALSQSHYAECNGSCYGLNCKSEKEYREKLEKRMEK